MDPGVLRKTKKINYLQKTLTNGITLTLSLPMVIAVEMQIHQCTVKVYAHWLDCQFLEFPKNLDSSSYLVALQLIQMFALKLEKK